MHFKRISSVDAFEAAQVFGVCAVALIVAAGTIRCVVAQIAGVSGALSGALSGRGGEVGLAWRT